MSNSCCVCHFPFDTLSPRHPLNANHPHYLLCQTCQNELKRLPYSRSDDQYDEIKARFLPFLRDTSVPEEVRDVFRKADDLYWDRKESNAAYEEALASAMDALLLTTGSTFDGYRVVKYLDIISSEIVFKNSFINSLSAGFDDFISSLSFREREMTGVARLIDNAKTYVMGRFREKAVNLGANAVLGIDFETTFGSDVVKVSVNGTAVCIDPID